MGCPTRHPVGGVVDGGASGKVHILGKGEMQSQQRQQRRQEHGDVDSDEGGVTTETAKWGGWEERKGR